MSPKNVNFSYPSNPLNNSLQNIQKLNETFFRETANYKNSVQKLFSNSKLYFQDEPLKPEFLTYHVATPNPNVPIYLSEVKHSDTQTKFAHFLKKCLLSSPFGCDNAPKTVNKACMCKPVKRRNTIDEKPEKDKYAEVYHMNGGSPKTKHIEGSSPSGSSEDSTKIEPEKPTMKESKKSGKGTRDQDEHDLDEDLEEYEIVDRKKKTKPKEDKKLAKETFDSNESLTGIKSPPQTCINDKSPKFMLQLPIDLGELCQSSGNGMKIVLCEHGNNICNCEGCAYKSKKRKKSKKHKKMNTEDGKKKKHWYSSCFSCCKRKKKSRTKSSQNQTEYSEKTHKHDISAPICADQVDTLKLLIKMEAKQNYRQINNIIRELNEQQEDIRVLKETNVKIIDHFPKIFGKNAAKTDIKTNMDLQENVKALFGMYKDLSDKISEIHRLSSDLIENNKPVSRNNYYNRPGKNDSISEQNSDDDYAKKSSSDTQVKSNSPRNSANYKSEVPERLSKPRSPSTKKHNCPCEINLGLYSSNSGK